MVNDLNTSFHFIEYIINDLVPNQQEFELKKITNINLYNRYLELTLYKNKMDQLTQKRSINDLR